MGLPLPRSNDSTSHDLIELDSPSAGALVSSALVDGETTTTNLWLWKPVKENVMSIVTHIGWSLLGTIALTSGLEWGLHRFLMHRRWLGKVSGNAYLKQQFRDHAILHHVTYYLVFNDEPDDFGKLHNLDISVISGLLVCAPFAIAMAFIDPITAGMFFAAGIFQPLVWSACHREMHVPTGVWWSRSWIFRYVRYHHLLHHQHPEKNLGGLFPFGDWLFGTAATANERDLRLMERLFGHRFWLRHR